MTDFRPCVLVVSTTFYPHPVVGSVRVTNWARMLPDAGWRCVNAARDYGAGATPDRLAAGVHPHARLWYLDGPRVGAPIDAADAGSADGSPSEYAPLADAAPRSQSRPPTKWKQRIKRVAGDTLNAVVAPDAQRLVWRRLWSRVERVIEAERPAVIVTSGPSHSIHLIGMRARRMGLPWVADYRDPSFIDPRFRPRGVGLLVSPWHRAFEREVYSRAEAVLHAIPLHARWARRRYALPLDRCRALTHPCPEDLASGAIEPARAPAGVRSVRVVGVIGEEESMALARAVEALSTPGHPVELRIVGPRPLREEAMRGVLGERLVAVGPVPHDEAKREIAGADVLVSYLTPERSRYMGVSSKLYEFAASRRPIVTLNPTRPDRLILRRLGDAEIVAPDRPAGLSEALGRALARAGKVDPLREVFLAQHSWKAHAQGLAEVLTRAASARRRR